MASFLSSASQSLSQNHWKPDESALMCSEPGCSVVFGLKDRKHHCRLCGDIVCSLHHGLQLRLRNSSDPGATALSPAAGGVSMVASSPLSLSSLSSLTSITSSSSTPRVAINPTTLPKTPTKGPSTIVVVDPVKGVLSPVCSSCYRTAEAATQQRGITRSRFELFARRRKGRLAELEARSKEVVANLRMLMNAGATTKEAQQAIVAWVPDSARTACNTCGVTFSLLTRRHHCRVCGNLVCGKCLHAFAHTHPDDGVEDPLAAFSASFGSASSAMLTQRVMHPHRVSSLEVPTCKACAHATERLARIRAVERAQNTPVLALYAEMQFKQTELELLMLDWDSLASKVKQLTARIASGEERLALAKAKCTEAQEFAAAQTAQNPNVTEELVERTMVRVRTAVRNLEYAEKELAELQGKMKPLLPEQERQKYILTKVFTAFDDLSIQILNSKSDNETGKKVCQAIRRAACDFLSQHKFTLVVKLVESRKPNLPGVTGDHS